LEVVLSSSPPSSELTEELESCAEAFLLSVAPPASSSSSVRCSSQAPFFCLPPLSIYSTFLSSLVVWYHDRAVDESYVSQRVSHNDYSMQISHHWRGIGQRNKPSPVCAVRYAAQQSMRSVCQSGAWELERESEWEQ
jgi:hypothetical protein